MATTAALAATTTLRAAVLVPGDVIALDGQEWTVTAASEGGRVRRPLVLRGRWTGEVRRRSLLRDLPVRVVVARQAA